MLKRFWEISEIKDKELIENFTVFSWLNKIIERENFTRDQIKKAYVDVMLWELELNEYTELHFQIKYLLDEVWVAVNCILNFYDSKVIQYLQASIELIKELNIPNDLRDNLTSFLDNGNNYSKMWCLILDSWKKLSNEFVIDKKNMSEEEIYNLLQQWNKSIIEKIKWNELIYVWLRTYL